MNENEERILAALEKIGVLVEDPSFMLRPGSGPFEPEFTITQDGTPIIEISHDGDQMIVTGARKANTALDEVLTAKGASKLFGVSDNWIRQLARAGKISSRRDGNVVLVLRSELMRRWRNGKLGAGRPSWNPPKTKKLSKPRRKRHVQTSGTAAG